MRSVLLGVIARQSGLGEVTTEMVLPPPSATEITYQIARSKQPTKKGSIDGKMPSIHATRRLIDAGYRGFNWKGFDWEGWLHSNGGPDVRRTYILSYL